MVNIISYIKIIRPVNALITACAVLLGMWLTSKGAGSNVIAPDSASAVFDPIAAALLMLAAAAAAGYGNVINDILDIKSDRVSHPKRPLASGAMTKRGAQGYAGVLVAVSLASAALVSTLHAAAALVPVALLTLYSTYFKRTRAAGNLVVAALTAYALLYGSLTSPSINILIVPACLAFLLNFCRELIKDVQDAAGDRAAGWRTSADLPQAVIRSVLLIAGGMYIVLVFVPSAVLGHFGAVYTAVCLLVVIPIHIYWMLIIVRSDIDKYAGRIGTVLKLEMVAGLCALALDKLF